MRLWLAGTMSALWSEQSVEKARYKGQKIDYMEANYIRRQNAYSMMHPR